MTDEHYETMKITSWYTAVEKCKPSFDRIIDKLKKEVTIFDDEDVDRHESFSGYLPKMDILCCLHENLEILYVGSQINFTFEGLDLGYLEYAYESESFLLMKVITEKTDKGISINFKRILDFDDFFNMILKSYFSNTNISMKETELIFQKMEFASI